MLSTSESEEMYLIHVAMAREQGIAAEVPLRRLAEMLSVTPVSVNQMVKKLVARDLLRYTPYRGVELTDQGAAIAAGVLRRRRLWAVFLADRLGLDAVDADRVACDFEHITPPEVADRLAGFLGDPVAGPQGWPIPGAAEDAEPEATVPLAELRPGESATVAAVGGSPAAASFLSAARCEPGCIATVLAVSDKGDVLAALDGAEVHLRGDVAAAIQVRR